ncbi:hypothetical protein QA612_04585 [Evansella sp. AB-P1]|uniref:hypothetical protein n=1 Tax=Evansella sp. AB-P1 TaxID=3037653 RepID=UPI00241D5235|nr:hypothetical protein [Evansella sp. AB-P1]MDG5786758.1 hypothetical protein [Evansella sp. AB-P1]
MILSKQGYLDKLKKELKKTPDSDEIVHEMDVHLSDVLTEIYTIENVSEKEAMKKLIDRVGTPREVASYYHQELQITPAKTQWTFIGINLFFFVMGVTLTAFYQFTPSHIGNQIWLFLTSIPMIIMLLYMFFWLLLGYEIGKEFGYAGKGLLFKTFYFTLVPNLLLMTLVVFRIIPLGWFDPLLSQPFIYACIACTILLYPISYSGYRWGIRRSI